MRADKVAKSLLATVLAVGLMVPVPALAVANDVDFNQDVDSSENKTRAESMDSISDRGASVEDDLVASVESPVGCIPELLEDQSLLSDEEIAAALSSGDVDLADSDDRIEPKSRAVRSYRMQAFSGSDRYETSSLQAMQWTNIASGTVVITNGDKFPDSLTASGLAGALGSPVLLVPTGSLNAYSKSALQHMRRVGAIKAIVIGGTSVISPNVVSQIESLGLKVETRLAGADRYDTQMKIYDYGRSRNFWTDQLVLVASGSDNAFCDALSASPVSYNRNAPIFLSNGSSKTLDSAQKTALQAAGKFGRAIIVGGPDCVSDVAVNYMKTVSNSSERIWGQDRYSTSRNLASKAISNGWLSKNNAAFASGSAPWDSLGGAALQGLHGSVLILVGKDKPTEATRIISGASTVKVFGGKAVVPSAVRLDIADSLGIPYAQVEGFKVYIDAGHGQNSSNNGFFDPGACSNGRREVDYTQDAAENLASALRDRGVAVYVNKSGWYKLRHAQAVALGCDMLISIHFNSGGNGRGSGSESYIHSFLASWKSVDLQNRVHPALIRGMGLSDRGKHREQLAVVGGELPACLLEVGFIDNDSDISRYNAQKRNLANSLADSLTK